MKTVALIPEERITRTIFVMRGQKVMLDRDLAELYGVTTSNLNKAVSRNLLRFPKDFSFHLTTTEYHSLRFQFGILERGQHSKYLPRVFTEDKNLTLKLAQHDRVLYDHAKNIRDLVAAINRLIKQPEPKRNPIGFGTSSNKGRNK